MAGNGLIEGFIEAPIGPGVARLRILRCDVCGWPHLPPRTPGRYLLPCRCGRRYPVEVVEGQPAGGERDG